MSSPTTVFERLDFSSRIFVAGHKGLVGSAIYRKLAYLGFRDIVTRTRDELNLMDQRAVHAFFKENRIDFVFMAAAKVGGIHYNNSYPADFLYENLSIALNVIHASAQYDVQKLLFLGSSCIYPKLAPQPMTEDALLSGPLEPTNEGYALAKIAGLKLCEKYKRQYGKNFISAMPTNLYGIQDNFHPKNSHVIPGMMRRFHEAAVSNAESVTVWGTGNCKREFLYVDDLAEALILLMEKYDEPTTINVGSGQDCSIREVAELMAETVNFKGELIFDTTKPDGPPRKLLNIDKIRALGWGPRITLRDGLKTQYRWALDNQAFEETYVEKPAGTLHEYRVTP